MENTELNINGTIYVPNDLRIGGRFNAAYTLLAAAAVNLVET